MDFSNARNFDTSDSLKRLVSRQVRPFRKQPFPVLGPLDQLADQVVEPITGFRQLLNSLLDPEFLLDE